MYKERATDGPQDPSAILSFTVGLFLGGGFKDVCDLDIQNLAAIMSSTGISFGFACTVILYVLCSLNTVIHALPQNQGFFLGQERPLSGFLLVEPQSGDGATVNLPPIACLDQTGQTVALPLRSSYGPPNFSGCAIFTYTKRGRTSPRSPVPATRPTDTSKGNDWTLSTRNGQTPCHVVNEQLRCLSRAPSAVEYPVVSL